MIKKIKEMITPNVTADQQEEAADKEQRIIMVDPSTLGIDMDGEPPAEPDLRILGLFADVHEEKIAELIHGLLVLDEINKLSKEDKQKPIEFYISTYGGNADDMFGLYDIIRQVKENHVNAVFIENIADNRMIEQISNETNATIGGKLFSGSLSDKNGPAPTYLQMMEYNITTIVSALTK